MARNKVERTKFRGLGRILRDIARIEGGVRIRGGNEFALVNIFVPRDGGKPTLRVMDSVWEPLFKFVLKDVDGTCYPNFMEYEVDCFMSGDGAWVLIRDEVVSVRGG